MSANILKRIKIDQGRSLSKAISCRISINDTAYYEPASGRRRKAYNIIMVPLREKQVSVIRSWE
ncbi:MAG: hypothetical protein BGO09_02375 [Bacteroidetes bacterium 47-18]|nr:MAG: hypothetical protein BGO09_02375 [Bacteroidetes bacterium 47-18]